MPVALMGLATMGAGCEGTILTPAGAPGGDDALPLADAAPGSGPSFADAAPEPDAGNGPVFATSLFSENWDGFNPGVPHDARFSLDVEGGAVLIDSVHVRTGHALHVHTDGNGRAFLRLQPFSAPHNTFYGRVYVFVNEFPSAPDFAHFTLVEAGSNLGGTVVRPLGGQYVASSGTSLWGVGSDGGATGDWTAWQPTTPAAAGRWQCLEWQMDASDNAIQVWIDGVLKPELSVSTQQHGGTSTDFVFPRFDVLRIGWQLYQGGASPAAFDLWYDDLVIATSRVGC